MDAKLSPPSVRRRRPWAVRPWTLVVFGLLLMAGTLIQACSDNNGTTGPTFGCQEAKAGASSRALAACTGSPAPTTGFANTAADIKVVVGINPNTITPGRRAGVTAFVTNLNGQPLAGKKVQFSTEVGTLDQTVVNTNAAGQASTTLSITPTDAANAGGKTTSTVTAFVDGAFGTGIVNFGGNAVLVLIPQTDVQSQVATTGGSPPTTCPGSTIGGFTITYTVSGGVPPYIFSRSNEFGSGATLSSSGVFTVTNPLPFSLSVGGAAAEVITVTDSTGATATASVTIQCIAPPAA